MATYANLETLGSIRTKLNNLITNFMEPGLTAKSLPLLLASTAFTYSTLSLKSVVAGDIITTKAEGFRYQVMASGDSDYDLATAGGVRLKLLPDANGEYSFDAMSPVKNGTTDNFAKLQRLLGRAQTYSINGRVGPTINFGLGQHYFAQTINLKSKVRLLGQYTGFNYTRGTEFLFPPSTAGLIVNRFNTFGATEDDSDPWGAGESEIIGIKFIGGRGTVFDETKSGIWLRDRAKVQNCGFLEFAGHGIAVIASTDGNPYLGNANGFILKNCFIDFNRGDGVRIQGIDVNAGWCEMMNCTRNGGWAVNDMSLLQNHHAAHHSESNQAGSYRCTNGCANYGSYTEGGAGDNTAWAGILVAPVMDNISTDRDIQGPALRVERGNGPVALANTRSGFRGTSTTNTTDIAGEPDSVLASRHDVTTISYPFRISWLASAMAVFIRFGESAKTLMTFGNNTTTETFGRSAAAGEYVQMTDLFLGFGSGARNVTTGTAPPASGARGRGDIVWNTNIASGQPMCWGCSVAGSPGTWIAGPNWP